MNWKLIRLIDRYVGIPLVYAFVCIRRILLQPYHAQNDPAAKKILLIKLWGIGNVFMMLPAVNSLRGTHPDVALDILTLDTNRDAVLQTHAFNSVTTVSTTGAGIFLSTVFTALRILRRREYDMVIDFEQFARFSALCTALIGGKITIGFNTALQHRHHLYSHPIPYDNAVHISRSYSALVSASGMVNDDSIRGPVLPSPECSDRTGSTILTRYGIRSDGIIVLLHVGTSSNFSERRWPTACYARLADLLIDHHNAQIVLGGLAGEKGIAAEVIAQSSYGTRINDTSGQMTFQEYFELICVSDLVVSADTMAVHVASALGVPVVGLYGPNTPVLYGPWGLNGLAFYNQLACSPCITNFNAKTHTCRHPDGKGACMKSIDPAEVYEEIRTRYLGKYRAASPEPAGAEPCSR